jgi:hypothetical protein
MEYENVLVLVLGTQDPGYLSFKQAIRDSWFKDFTAKGIRVLFYEGGYESTRLNGDTIELTTSDSLNGTAIKMKEAFRFVLNNYPDVKYIYRTNLSSFLEVNGFKNFMLNRTSHELAYCGIIGRTTTVKEFFYLKSRLLTYLFNYVKVGKKIEFASGSGFFISINNVQKYLGFDVDNQYIDDVYLGKILSLKLDSKKMPIRFDISDDNSHKISSVQYEDYLNKNYLFHYRCKTKERAFDQYVIRSFSDPLFRYNFCCNGES